MCSGRETLNQNLLITHYSSLPGKTHCQDGRKTLSCIEQEVKGGLGARIQRWRKPRETALSFGCCWRPRKPCPSPRPAAWATWPERFPERWSGVAINVPSFFLSIRAPAPAEFPSLPPI